MKIRLAAIFAVAIVVAPAAFAQGGKNAPAAPIPYHSFVGGDSLNLSVGANADVPVPAGKRLIVEYVSLFLDTPTATVQSYMNCQIRGLGPNATERAHYIPVQDRSNGINSTRYTGAGPVKMYLEAGDVDMYCDSGTNGFSLSLRGWISGQLVDAQ